MTRTEKLLAELIALPSVNPAFTMQSVASAQPVRSLFGEKNIADFLAEQSKAYAAAGKPDADTLALEDLCQSLFGLNEFVYVE